MDAEHVVSLVRIVETKNWQKLQKTLVLQFPFFCTLFRVGPDYLGWAQNI